MTKHQSAAMVLSSLNTGNELDAKKLGRLISTISTSGRKLDEQIHGAAVATIYRSMPHSDGGHLDCSFAAKLMNAMPKGSRAKALAAWFAAFSNIRVLRDDKAGEWKAKLVPHNAKDYAEARPADALLKPFWTAEEASTDPKAFDDDALAKRIASLIKAAEGDSANLSDKGKALIAGLRKLQPAE